MYLDNKWYGHKKIILNYINSNSEYLFCTIQHGWITEERIKKLNYGKRKITFAPFLCWNDKTKKIIESNKINNIIAIGSPFLYLIKSEKVNIRKKIKNIGTLAFPFHSTNEENIEFDHKNFILEIEKNFTPPFVVSLYYDDLKEDIIKLYKNKGWKIINFGDRENINFLNNFINKVSKFKTVVFSEISTGLFYSMYLNIETKILHSYIYKNKVYYFRDYKTNIQNKKKINEKFIKKYSFLGKHKYDYEKGFSLACEELGMKYIKNSDELAKILMVNNIFIHFLSYLINLLIKLKYMILK